MLPCSPDGHGYELTGPTIAQRDLASQSVEEIEHVSHIAFGIDQVGLFACFI